MPNYFTTALKNPINNVGTQYLIAFAMHSTAALAYVAYMLIRKPSKSIKLFSSFIFFRFPSIAYISSTFAPHFYFELCRYCFTLYMFSSLSKDTGCILYRFRLFLHTQQHAKIIANAIMLDRQTTSSVSPKVIIR